ncbi:MAG: nucleotidyltransferase domain-containing protein [Thermoplasmatota archaeon]
MENEDEWISISDASKILDANKMTVRRSLEKLFEADLLEEKNDGYRRYFKLKDSELVPALKRIKNIDSKLVGSLVEYFQGKVTALLLYGSRAEGKNVPESDWDVLIVSDDIDPLEISRKENEMGSKFGEALNLHLYTTDQVIHMRDENAPFYLELMKKNVPLVGDLDDIR